jgi:hypothetical protein
MKAILFSAFLMWGDGHNHTHMTVDDMPTNPTWIHPVITIYGRTVQQEGKWVATPDILICHNGPVTPTRVESALRYWRKLGYTFGSVTQALPGNRKCLEGDASYGTVTIDIPSQGFRFGTHLGTTRTYRYTATGEIFKARIEIIPAWGKSERILEHELGHALGWKDVNSVGHIMNGVWSSGGFNSYGVKNVQ